MGRCWLNPDRDCNEDCEAFAIIGGRPTLVQITIDEGHPTMEYGTYCMILVALLRQAGFEFTYTPVGEEEEQDEKSRED